MFGSCVASLYYLSVLCWVISLFTNACLSHLLSRFPLTSSCPRKFCSFYSSSQKKRIFFFFFLLKKSQLVLALKSFGLHESFSIQIQVPIISSEMHDRILKAPIPLEKLCKIFAQMFHKHWIVVLSFSVPIFAFQKIISCGLRPYLQVTSAAMSLPWKAANIFKAR